MAVSFIGGGNWSTGENHRSVESQDENNFNTCVRIAVGVCPCFYFYNALNKKVNFVN